MAAWPDRLDHFLGHYPHLIAGLEAISTFAVVIVSVSLALVSQRASRTRLNASGSISFIIHDLVEDKDNPPTYFTINITNTGVMPLKIPFAFFHWRIPLRRRGAWLVNPLDYYGVDSWAPQKKYPVEINPRASDTFFVSDITTFRQMIVEHFVSRTGFLERYQFRFSRPRVVTDDGATFKVKLQPEVWREISKLWKARRPRNFPQEDRE
jgi:hypothetical protein